MILIDVVCIGCGRRSRAEDWAGGCDECDAPLFPAAPPLLADLAQAPRLLERRYLPYRRLSEGESCDVWLAWQPCKARNVVLKVLTTGTPADIARFEREADVQRSLLHPGIPAVIEAGRDAGLPCGHFTAIEYVEGETLLDYSDALLGVLDEVERIRRVVRVTIDAADALESLHCRGYVHRDVKPTNILISRAGGVFLIDYGLARPVDDALTIEGTVLGTAPFMSPEQFSGVPGDIDARTDVWALGAMLYLLFTARYVFTGSTFEQIADRVQTAVPVPARTFNPSIPAEVDRAIQKALSKLPERRYPSAGEFAAALRSCL